MILRFHLAHLSSVSAQGQALPKLETNANHDCVYEIGVRENLNVIDSSRMTLTFELPPLGLVEAEVPLHLHRPHRHRHHRWATPATVDHSLSQVAGWYHKGLQAYGFPDHYVLYHGLVTC